MNVKMEPVWKDEKCPNVEIRNGVLCAVERKVLKEENGSYSRGTFSRGRKASEGNEARRHAGYKDRVASGESGEFEIVWGNLIRNILDMHNVGIT